jgi:hypothetical protein
MIKGLTESEDDSSSTGMTIGDYKMTFQSKIKEPPTIDSHQQNVTIIKEEVAATNELEEERLSEFLDNSDSFQEPELENDSITDEGSSSQIQMDDPVS